MTCTKFTREALDAEAQHELRAALQLYEKGLYDPDHAATGPQEVLFLEDSLGSHPLHPSSFITCGAHLTKASCLEKLGDWKQLEDSTLDALQPPEAMATPADLIWSRPEFIERLLGNYLQVPKK